MLNSIHAAIALVVVSEVFGGSLVAAQKNQAVLGQPFGVATAEFRLRDGLRLTPDNRGFQLRERNGRLLYPVFKSNGKLLDRNRTQSIRTLSVQFLFLGDDDLSLELLTSYDVPQQATLRCVQSAEIHKASMNQWWQDYKKSVDQLAMDRRYPTSTDRALATMLAKRLGFGSPQFNTPWHQYQNWDQAFGIMVGTESIRIAMQKDTIFGGLNRAEPAVHELPQSVKPPAIRIPDVPEGTEVEAIALHVPEDCFYIRCGSFSNFLWLKDNVSKWGSRFRDMVFTTGKDYGIGQVIERQLALKQTALSRLFGDSVVSDVAIIGADPFVREGMSVGIVFEAKSNRLLKRQIDAQRADALKANPNARQTTEMINGSEVVVVKSPDNRVRSFYAIHGDYHFVTNSRSLAKDFLAASSGGRSLGSIKEFRHARHLMPISRNDTAFIYLSDPFFSRLVSAPYRVEMTRRMQALADVELVELAIAVAKAEGRDHKTVDDLISGGVLPAHFRNRTDGGLPVIQNGEVADSIRGSLGVFTPVTDVDVTKVTLREQAEYKSFARMYQGIWTRMDPVTIGMKRTPLANQKERIAFDIHITPYPQRQFSFFFQLLAKPNKQKLPPIADDLFAIEVNFNSMALHWVAKDPPKDARVFAGFQDAPIPFEIIRNNITPAQFDFNDLGQLKWYLGITPHVVLNNEEVLPPDKDGYFRAPGVHPDGDWLRHWNDFRARSPQKEILQKVTPQLKLADAERAAQIRLRVAKLGDSHVGKFVNAAGYCETRELSAVNARMVHRLSEQLALDAKTAYSTLETLSHAKLVCPLGGEFQVVTKPHRPDRFESTAWNGISTPDINSIPDGYRFPFLEWFNGLEIEFSIDATTLTTHVEVELDNQ